MAAVAEAQLGPGQIEFPHPPEAGIEHRRDVGIGHESLAPDAAGLGVVQAQDLDVGDPQVGLLDGRDDFRQAGDVAAREDVFLGEGVGGARPVHLADRVNQGHAVVVQQAMDGLEIGPEVRRADVFQHADRDDAVELLVQVAIVGQAEVGLVGQARLLGALLGQGQLLGRQGDPGHLGAEVLGQGHGEAAPARADVQRLHARLDQQLAADEGLLRRLGLFQRHVRTLEIGAGILHVGVEEPAIELVGDVVVVGDVLARGHAVVDLLDAPLQRLAEAAQGRAALGFAPAALAHDRQQLVDRALFEDDVAFHVAFAETQAGIGQPAQAPAVDPDGDRRSRAVPRLDDATSRQVRREIAGLDHFAEQGFDHGHQLKHKFGRDNLSHTEETACRSR